MPHLDGLRAVAVVLVLVHHAVAPGHFGGWVGVYIFFALSGFLITGLLMKEHERTGRVRLGKFYLRRALRLYPPLLTAIIVLAPLGIATVGVIGYIKTTGVAATYLTNLYITVVGHGVLGWSHTWTLALEEQFYFVWPILFIAAFTAAVRFRRTRIVALSAIAAASVLAGSALFRLGFSNENPALTFGALAAGCVLALTRRSWASKASYVHGILGAALIAVAVVVGSFAAVAGAALALSTLGSLLLIACLAEAESPLSPALASRPLVYVGSISYELYLWHFPLMMYPAALFDTTPGTYWWVALPLTFAGAALSHRYVTIPLNRKWKPRLAS